MFSIYYAAATLPQVHGTYLWHLTTTNVANLATLSLDPATFLCNLVTYLGIYKHTPCN